MLMLSVYSPWGPILELHLYQFRYITDLKLFAETKNLFIPLLKTVRLLTELIVSLIGKTVILEKWRNLRLKCRGSGRLLGPLGRT